MLQAIFALTGIVLYLLYLRKKAHPTLPPGPKPLPIIGNITDLPSGRTPEYQHWLKFKDAYGPISRVSILGQPLVIIHDRHAAHDLLVGTSSKTSGRPYLHFAAKLCGYGTLLSFQQYDAEFRQQRKLVHQQLGTKTAVARFRDVQDVESRRFLFRVLEDPKNLVDHIKTEASAIILRITYGYSIEPRKADPLARLIERMMQGASLAFVPLSWPVDILPILEYFPECLPGMSFKKIAREWNGITRKVIETPYNFVRQQMAKGTHRLSYVSSLIEQHDDSSEKGRLNEGSENAIKNTAAIMYAGGSDTTVSSINSLILAMVLFPAVQKKAQQEIDTVVGTNRLPQFGDRDSLPYVNALVKETIRWFPVAPMGAVHQADEDVDYGGFHISKGTQILPAIWWFLHDPQTYPDPSSFNPDRFLEPRNEPDPANEAFGYGRRICPGRFLADESLFITISRLLAAFDIRKAIDKQGNEIDPQIEVTPGLISHLLDFPHSIKPRNANYASLIRSIEVEHPWEKSDAGMLEGDFATV
ncbi:O-methylsterigmatocystin oxidoreductase [Neonectria ditissima]|uniref:O-methylsterigmatocystin oxidoreductase n=1 Tax=Neonectria ditissima TaxID=78410 RepID=A0A0P7BFP2_9HYPO|nr:O-methylsterigmatocystin oxidoreductase [Neonectria ditissima]